MRLRNLGCSPHVCTVVPMLPLHDRLTMILSAERRSGLTRKRYARSIGLVPRTYRDLVYLLEHGQDVMPYSKTRTALRVHCGIPVTAWPERPQPRVLKARRRGPVAREERAS